jgi:peroxidase
MHIAYSCFFSFFILVPPSITQKPLDQRVAAGQAVKISCNATGAPNPVISWIKDDVHITEGNRYSTNQQGVLTVRDVSKSDEGRYECAARNSIGVATARMILFVEGGYQKHTYLLIIYLEIPLISFYNRYR